MATWIFQGNPNHFDIEGYLAASPGTILWLVSRHEAEISEGDSVYIWRSQGKEKGNAGIVAHATVIARPTMQEEDALSAPFWIDADRNRIATRATLRLTRVANKKEVLKRDWFKDDSVLKNLLILRMASGTNFRVLDDEAQRLDQLWKKTGSDWQRDEIVAALSLYGGLWDQSVSKTEDSQVERLAQKIGRAPSGVYNKLMNFRSLDPRRPEKGFDKISKSDRAIWAEFFDVDGRSLKQEALKAEMERLWNAIPVAGSSDDAARQREITRLSGKSERELMEEYTRRPSPGKPRRKPQLTQVFDRDPLVVALRKKLAQYRCEVDNCPSPIFFTSNGEQFVEVHHLVQIADGGEDRLGNTAALCPCHHRLLHYGVEKGLILKQLLEKRHSDGTAEL